MWQIIIILLVSLAAVLLGIRYYLLCRSIRGADTELQEIIKHIEDNRIVKLERPNRELEPLLITVNQALKLIRSQRISYMKREKEFRGQIENISHDLRTPLTSIHGYLKLLDQSGLKEEDRRDLDTVVRKARFLQRLVEQFYEYSRLTGEEELSREPVDVARLLRETALDAYHDLEECGLSAEFSIPEEAVWVCAEADGLERVFQNLFQNAGRYAKSRLWVTLEKNQADCRIIFENDAEYIRQEDAGRIFDRFYRLDSSREESATGLGLTITKCLVEKMGGKIRASLPGDGRLRIEIGMEGISHMDTTAVL